MFIDFKNALNSVNRSILLEELNTEKTAIKLRILLTMTLENTKARVRF